MKPDSARVTQILFYVLVAEIALMLIRTENKPIVDTGVMKWVLVVTAILLVSSVVYFFVKAKKAA